MSTKPVIFNDSADVVAANALFDHILEKPYGSPMVAIGAIRMVLNLYGITLPKLDVETQVEGPNSTDALSYLFSGKRVDMPGLDCEYLFKVIDNNHIEDMEHTGGDWDDSLYLYIVLDRNDDNGTYDAYAQLVDVEDVEALVNQDIPAEMEKKHGGGDEDKGDKGHYLKQTRHTAHDYGGSSTTTA